MYKIYPRYYSRQKKSFREYFKVLNRREKELLDTFNLALTVKEKTEKTSWKKCLWLAHASSETECGIYKGIYLKFLFFITIFAKN